MRKPTFFASSWRLARQARRWWRIQAIYRAFPGLDLAPPVIWTYDDLSAVEIEGSASIGPFSEIITYARSEFSKVPGHLFLGDRVVIGSGANIRAAGGRISIGRASNLAQHVSLIAANHRLTGTGDYFERWDEEVTGVELEENVWIGAGATVLPGCRIGRNSVVGAGSVVTRSIPANEVWAGVPARKLRDIS